ncbi:hypothetical protein C1H46_021288 [Malus baccata]|uniref:Uncharacterized protein n=1 Tax=Malus baccata TaxID=106549 RepID=A0A540M2W6_MALBA|nr:hypothetical protein C1H46_021288 [Malus baccata]
MKGDQFKLADLLVDLLSDFVFGCRKPISSNFRVLFWEFANALDKVVFWFFIPSHHFYKRVFGIEKLGEATDGFRESSLIKGSVYKGFINGDFYAIKKVKWNTCEELKIL